MDLVFVASVFFPLFSVAISFANRLTASVVAVVFVLANHGNPTMTAKRKKQNSDIIVRRWQYYR
jgi:uncharacterized membrane protein